MKREFKRYGLERLRVLTGILEILGGAGLVLGLYYFPPLLVFSSAGLALLMFFACWVRFRARDSLLSSLPAIFFMVLNIYIARA